MRLDAAMQNINGLALYEDQMGGFFLYSPNALYTDAIKGLDAHNLSDFITTECGVAMISIDADGYSDTTAPYAVVKYAQANHGFGPPIYMIAMQSIRPVGLASDNEGRTSAEAQRVWDEFMKRGGDIQKHLRTPHDCCVCDNEEECADCDGFTFSVLSEGCRYYYVATKILVDVSLARKLHIETRKYLESLGYEKVDNLFDRATESFFD